MMLSESQERMLMVLRPEKEAEAKAVFDKWDLDFAIVGETIDEDRFLIQLNGETMADLPLKALSGSAPEYDRPWVATPAPAPLTDTIDIAPIDGLKALLSSPNYGAKNWVFEQYDHMVMADTIRRPGLGAGVVRVHGTQKALAFTSDVTPRYCRANPERGGAQAVAEAFRNLSAVGALPLAATDNMNFGNPEKPEIMGQFVGCITGIGAACKALEMPIVSGNVSLYNETDGSGILPTPTIGAVGLLKDVDQVISGTSQPGDIAVLIGQPGAHLGQSALLAEALGRDDGDAPDIDLAAEKRNGDFVRTHGTMIRAATDLSDGGLAMAAFELAENAGCGLAVESGDTGWFFGEDQARYLLALPATEATMVCDAAKQAGVPARIVGSFGGTDLRLGEDIAALAELGGIYRTSFAAAVA